MARITPASIKPTTDGNKFYTWLAGSHMRRPISRVYEYVYVYCWNMFCNDTRVHAHEQPRVHLARWCVKSGTAGMKMDIHGNVQYVRCTSELQRTRHLHDCSRNVRSLKGHVRDTSRHPRKNHRQDSSAIWFFFFFISPDIVKWIIKNIGPSDFYGLINCLAA